MTKATPVPINSQPTGAKPAPTKRGRNRSRKQVPPIRAIERGLLVLEVLGHDGSASLSDISRATELSRSTTFRILETLRQRGYVEQNETDGLYHIGFKAVQMRAAYSATSPLPLASHPVMKELVEKINEAVNLVVLDGNEAVYVHQVEAEHSIRMFTQLGARTPLHCTGVGKVLLAWQPMDQVEQLLGGPQFKSFTSTTIAKMEDMVTELERVRKRGYAVDNEERERGVRCIAAPVRDAYGTVVAALSVSAPTTRFPKKKLAAWAREIKAAANQVSNRLGFVLREG